MKFVIITIITLLVLRVLVDFAIYHMQGGEDWLDIYGG